VSIRIKAPVPMLVAMLPSATANQLHARPELLEEALAMKRVPATRRAIAGVRMQV